MSNNRIDLPIDRIYHGDCLELIRELPESSVQLVITSPPYFQQRNYGNGSGLGNETELDEYVANLLNLFRECVRVLKEQGSIVFNLGDKYQKSNLLLIPYRFAIAATDKNPVKLVNNITWAKKNPTPRQFQRRLVSSTEPFFHFVKSDRYFYNLKAFMKELDRRKQSPKRKSQIGQKYFRLIEESDLSAENKLLARHELTEVIQEVKSGKIESFRMKIRGVHAEPFGGQAGGRKSQLDKKGFTIIRIHGNKLKKDFIEMPVETVKGCKHPAIYPVSIVEEFLHLLTNSGDLVLDPFMGSGSTAIACKKLNRHYIGYELNPEYCAYANERIANTPSETFYICDASFQ